MDADLKAAGERHYQCGDMCLVIVDVYGEDATGHPCDAARFRDALTAAEAERSRLADEIRRVGRFGVAIEGNISSGQARAYSEGFHRGIREALSVFEDER